MRGAPHLERVVGVTGVAFTAFNCIVGVGIFSLPGLVAGVLGPAAILAYLVCAILIGLVGLCFAEAGSRVSGSGGLYAYADAAFGPVVGGVAGALVLFAGAIGSAGLDGTGGSARRLRHGRGMKLVQREIALVIGAREPFGRDAPDARPARDIDFIGARAPRRRGSMVQEVVMEILRDGCRGTLSLSQP